jgi:hypothetical protein
VTYANRAIDATSPEDLRRCVELAAVLPDGVFNAALDRCVEPTTAFEVWLALNQPLNRVASATERRIDDLPDRLIWKLPSKVVTGPTRDNATSQTCRRFVQMLCARLGDDLAKWQLLGELACDHDGTADELVTMVELGVGH